MEVQVNEKKAKPSQKNVMHCLVRVTKETRKRVFQDLARINKKDVGKRVRADAYFALAVSKIAPSDLKTLQDESLTHTDRLEMDYREYVAKHGVISKDAYLGKRLSGEALDLSKSATRAADELSP